MSTQTDEQHLREVIDSAMSATRPPHDLPATALARGRRLRTRRRGTYAVAGIAATLALAVAAPWVATGGDRPVRSDDVVATQPPTPLPATLEGWWDMPATDMVSAVEAILPDGVTVTDPGPLQADSPEGGPAAGAVTPVLAGSAGPGSLNVVLYPPAVPPAQADGTEVGPGQDATCAGEFLGDRARCEELLDESGAVVGHRLTQRWRDGVAITEVVLRRDGGTVYVASSNTVDDKWSADSPVTAPRPPLTLDDLENLVRNDVWVSYRP